MKIIIAIGLVAIVAALASAGLFMLRGDSTQAGREKRMARALAVRVGLSIALFVLILVSYKLGWIRPTGLPIVH